MVLEEQFERGILGISYNIGDQTVVCGTLWCKDLGCITEEGLICLVNTSINLQSLRWNNGSFREGLLLHSYVQNICVYEQKFV